MLPTKNDFNPWGPTDLDAQTAWRNFGGLTLAEAHLKFRERPWIYQEDFMFMGGKAFVFYFPVIEDYLREGPEAAIEGDDREAWILAKGIQNQFRSDTANDLTPLVDRVIALSRFVQEHSAFFGFFGSERVADVWRELEDELRAARTEHGAG